MKFQLHTAGVVALLTTIAGICSSPAVLGIVPMKVAGYVIAAGVIAQSVTKGIQMGGTDLVPKVNS